jgi:hypothetical protein
VGTKILEEREKQGGDPNLVLQILANGFDVNAGINPQRAKNCGIANAGKLKEFRRLYDDVGDEERRLACDEPR